MSDCCLFCDRKEFRSKLCTGHFKKIFLGEDANLIESGEIIRRKKPISGSNYKGRRGPKTPSIVQKGKRT